MIAERLQERERGWALVGGLAVSARTEPRFTSGIDLAVAVRDDPDAERLVHALRRHGFVIRASVEQTRTARLATIRLTSPGKGRDQVVVDLLFASSGLEDLVVAAATPLEVFAGLHLPVARIGHLIALKALARDDKRRPQDAVDLAQLLAAAGDEERALAEAGLAEITRRGFHRNRVLLGEWRRLIAP